jgi:hypothetical protein
MTAYLLSPFYPVADKLDTSHRAGWARYWAHALTAFKVHDTVTLLTTGTMAELDQARKGDTVYCYHGMEWGGAMNLQSGVTDEVVTRMRRLVDAVKRGVKLVSVDIPMPPYGKLINDRSDTSADAMLLADKLTRATSKQGYLMVPSDRPKHIIMGDSHALSQYVPGSVIYRTDGQTLHGALAQGLSKRLGDWAFMAGIDLLKLPELTVYFGNIDVRHHLLRQDEPLKAGKHLIAEYGKQLADLQKEYRIGKINVVMPLPIENECRVLPKTGWYKGTPFHGTWAQRTEMVKLLRRSIANMAKAEGFTTIDHPKHFTKKSGELSFDVMEQPRSVHIRPSEYRIVQENGSW